MSKDSNFEINDKLYLLSAKEVWGTAQDDTVDKETRQLDYYNQWLIYVIKEKEHENK